MNRVLPALAAGLAVLGAVFWREEAAAIGVWRSSTAYGHCWFIVPLVGWLVWERRAVFSAIPALPAAWPALLALPVAAIWLAADWLGVMEGRQLAWFGFVELLLLAGLGARLWWALAPALLYLVFAVPFGAFVTPFLQGFTTGFVDAGLSVLNIPHSITANQIEIPEGIFYVAEACAGLRFLVASVAFGALYAILMYRSPWRRVAFIAVSTVLPVVANGFRALGIVLLGHAIGNAQAAAADHLIYGWVFFSVVIVLLTAAGLPWREDAAPAPVRLPAPSAPRGRVWIAAAAVVAIAALAPAGEALIESRAVADRAAFLPAALPPGCTGGPATIGAQTATQTLTCGTGQATLTLDVLPRRASPGRVLTAAEARADAAVAGDTERTAGPAGWSLVTNKETGEQAAYRLFVDGRVAGFGLRDRWRMARDMAFGSACAPVVMTLEMPPGGKIPGGWPSEIYAACKK